MENDFALSNPVMRMQAVSEIVALNKKTGRYGLFLSQPDAVALLETRNEALAGNGRIEFGGGLVNKLILAFCDSPFLSQGEYAAVLGELIDIFYYYKNESSDRLSDDELISFMKKSFDESCGGSVELLRGRELEDLAREFRSGISGECPDYGDEEREGEELE